MASNVLSSTLHLQALSQAGFNTSLRSVDDATGASNSVVRQKREERKRCVHTLLELSYMAQLTWSYTVHDLHNHLAWQQLVC